MRTELYKDCATVFSEAAQTTGDTRLKSLERHVAE